MAMEKSKVLIQFLVIFRQFVDVLSILYARRLRGCTATVRNEYSLSSQSLCNAVVINLIKLIDIVNFALNYCTEVLKRWICMISTQISNKNSTVKVDYNRDIDLGEYSLCSVTVPFQSGLLH